MCRKRRYCWRVSSSLDSVPCSSSVSRSHHGLSMDLHILCITMFAAASVFRGRRAYGTCRRLSKKIVHLYRSQRNGMHVMMCMHRSLCCFFLSKQERSTPKKVRNGRAESQPEKESASPAMQVPVFGGERRIVAQV